MRDCAGLWKGEFETENEANRGRRKFQKIVASCEKDPKQNDKNCVGVEKRSLSPYNDGVTNARMRAIVERGRYESFRQKTRQIAGVGSWGKDQL